MQEVQLPHRRHYLAARGVEGPEWYSLPILEYVTSAGEGQLRPTTWTVSETHAILRYICHSHAQAALWYPRELSVRIRVDEYLDWHLAVFRRAMHGLWQLSLNAALRLTNRDTDQPMQKVRSLVASSLQTLDVRLSQHEFIATDEDPTIADLVAATEVNSLVIMGWDMALYGQITRWRETMQLVRLWSHCITCKILTRVASSWIIGRLRIASSLNSSLGYATMAHWSRPDPCNLFTQKLFVMLLYTIYFFFFPRA